MSSEFFPVTAIAKQLESATISEFQTLLKLLRQPEYINEKLLKSELALLLTKTLALLRSSNDEHVWRGCHTAVVICAYNPLVLCSHSGQLLAAIYAKLEQKVDYYNSTMATLHGKVLFETLVFAISNLIELMRDKPTLSRESLTPKLKVIIPTIINLAQYQPKICLPVLKRLLYKNTTTFKPFVSKFRQVLAHKISDSYEQFDTETQKLLCESFAYLHLIKIHTASSQDEALAHHKSFHDENWRIGMFSILCQFKPIIELCGEILDLEQDRELGSLINSLKCDNIYKADEKVAEFSLARLKLDMNSPLTLWEIPRRLNLLIDLLSAFICLPTPNAIRVPFGTCVNICEALLSMTRNYLPLRRDLRRDSQLTSVINQVIPQIQYSGIRLLSKIVDGYGKSCLSLLPSILGSLELFIPLKPKSTNIDFEKCSVLKKEFLSLFKTVNLLFPHMGHQFHEIDLFTKLTDVALYLSEDISLADLLFNKQQTETKNNLNGSKKKQKKETSQGALSDLYTHSDKFEIRNLGSWHDEINLFLRGVLSSWKLPSNQQTKIIKYSILYSLKLKEEFGYIPDSFVQLLRTEVIYPGNERVSILPIAVSLLKNSNDNVFDVICHPRLPMGLIHPHRKPAEDLDALEGKDEKERKASVTSEDFSTEAAKKIQSDNEKLSIANGEEELTAPGNTAIEIDESLIFKKRSMDQGVTEVEIIKRHKVSDITSTNEIKINQKIAAEAQGDYQGSKKTKAESGSEEDDSEFEIPTIQLSDDDGDDEE